LLDSEGHIRLTDFGLSKKYDGTKAQTFCGTPEYLAPEVIMGAGHGKEVDWWSLGILLYEMIVGIPPWYSENVNHMYDMIQRGDLRMPSIVSAVARDLIVGLLVRNPAHRLGTGQGDVEDIKAKPFFAGLDFEALLRKEIAPSFVPVFKGKGDTSNFDEEFTNEPVVDSFAPSTAMSQQKFENFTYVPSSAMGTGEE
jgi:serine/threonine protein kinase